MKALVLRKCNKDFTSNGGSFKYPEKGYVEAPDWDGKPVCGGSLHGLLWGSGYFDISDFGELWQVIEVDKRDIVEFDGKCKFKCGNVLLTTESQIDAITMLKRHEFYPQGNILNYDINDSQFAISGYRSMQTAGDGSTQKAGSGSTQKAGSGSTQTAGYRSMQTAGDYSTQTAGIKSVQIGWWLDSKGNYCVVSRKITKVIANKPYYFKNGKWTLIKEMK